MSATDRAAAGGQEPPAATRRTDEEVFSRPGIRIRMYGADHFIPVLPRRASREWRERFQGTLDGIWAGFKQIDKTSDGGTLQMLGLADDVLDAAAAMVAAYDRDGVLGGPDEIDAKGTDEEAWEAAKAIAGYVYPFAKDLAGYLPQLFDALTAVGTPAASESSTDSASDAGASAPGG